MEVLKLTGPIDVRYVGTKDWRLLSPIEVEYDDGKGRMSVMANVGFSHDFASVPGPVQRLPFVGRFFKQIDFETARASIIHDYLYVNEPDGFTRKKADDLFYAILRYDGVSWFKAQAMHKAVRSFGWMLWDGEDHKPFEKN
jgi:hypothetical protein